MAVWLHLETRAVAGERIKSILADRSPALAWVTSGGRAGQVADSRVHYSSAGGIAIARDEMFSTHPLKSSYLIMQAAFHGPKNATQTRRRWDFRVVRRRPPHHCGRWEIQLRLRASDASLLAKPPLAITRWRSTMRRFDLQETRGNPIRLYLQPKLLMDSRYPPR